MRKLLITIQLLLISSLCFSQYYTKAQIDSMLKDNAIVLKGEGFILKKVLLQSDTLIFTSVPTAPLPPVIQTEYVSFKPLYYAELKSDNIGNFTTLRNETSVSSNRGFTADGSISFKFINDFGASVLLTNFGLRSFNGKLWVCVYGRYEVLPNVFNKNTTYSLERVSGIITIYEIINGVKTKLESSDKYGLFSGGNAKFESFIPLNGDGINDAKISSTIIINQ